MEFGWRSSRFPIVDIFDGLLEIRLEIEMTALLWMWRCVRCLVLWDETELVDARCPLCAGECEIIRPPQEVMTGIEREFGGRG